MDKQNCMIKYYEPETEEHLKGKRILYEWIKKQKDVVNVILEGRLSETKQRPDIVFEYHDKKYVIEYQCTPISTEYLERHDLYQVADIKDIWICGTKKYLKNNVEEKFLQNYSVGFLDVSNSYFIPSNIEFTNIFLNGSIKLWKIRNLKDFIFDGEIINKHLGHLNNIYYKRKKRIEYKQSLYCSVYQKNKYLIKQKNKIHYLLKNNLNILSNNNWCFYLEYEFSGNERIVAEPVSVLSYNDYIFRRDFKNVKYKYIIISDLDFDLYKKCGRDINYLKQLLLPIMSFNKQALLNYKSDTLRFLEVKNE